MSSTPAAQPLSSSLAPTHGPLDGIRIADLTIITAGAASTQLLGDYGADVIKVESASYMDPSRRAWGQHHFNVVSRNKRGVLLDLKHPLGRATFLRLVAVCDVVTENFRRGVMERLGLGFDDLVKVKPDLVMVSIGSQASGGPESSYGSYGSTLDALSGLMSITGYDHDSPLWSSSDLNYPDQIAPLFGAASVLLGLRQRQRTGRPVRVEISQRELVTTSIGEVVLDNAVNGRIAGPEGNRDSSMAPHGVYRCAGEDSWVAIVVETDQQWSALCAVLDRPELATDERYATFPERWRNQDELDSTITSWTQGQDKRTAMEMLQRAGVPAGAVLNGRELLEDPNLGARGFYRRSGAEASGLLHRTWPFRLSRTPGYVYRPAPGLGEHTDEVLREVLGMSASEIADLADAGVIELARVSTSPE